MARIFISHSSRDNEEASRIKTWLAEQGFEAPFLDFDKHTGIAPGSNWEQTLYREIDQSDALLIVQTPNWLESKWCFAEFTQARALGKPIFPVIYTPTGDTLIAPDIQALDLTRDVEGGLDQLARELTEIALDAQSGFKWDRNRAPYPGLLAFQQDDAAIYFGRDDDIRRLTERLNARRTQGGAKVIALLGASGAGKSSLMRAGVIPRLKRAGRNWIVLPPMRPQTRPLDELARTFAIALERGPDWRSLRTMLQSDAMPDALRDLTSDLRALNAANEAQVLLPVDQAEELFGASDPAQAAQFMDVLNALEETPDAPMTALLAMRSDYLGALQGAERLHARFEEFSLGPMPLARIAQIIEGPARVAGLGIDEGLVHQAAADAQTEDALPLLAFALRELYDSAADDNFLSLDEYTALGDPSLGLTPLENAVRRAADTVLGDLAPSDEDLKALREAFIPDMVRINDKGEYVRQPARWQDLPARAHPILNRLADARLLIIRQEEDDKIVEVAHEALLRKWPRLRGWLDEAREFLAGKQQLEQDRFDWEHASDEVKDSALLTGLKLNRARAWLTERPTQLSAEDRAFIQASIDRFDAEEMRKARSRKRILGASVAVSVLMAGLTVFAGYQWVATQRSFEQRLGEQINLVWNDLGTRSSNEIRISQLVGDLRFHLDDMNLPFTDEDRFKAMNSTLYSLERPGEIAHSDGFDCATFLETGFRALYCAIRTVVSLEKLQTLSGHSVYRSGGPHAEEFDFAHPDAFGHYNPEFLTWIGNRIVPDGPDDPRVNFASQSAYDVQLGPLIRALYHSYLVLHADDQTALAVDADIDRFAGVAASTSQFERGWEWSNAEIFTLDEVIDAYHTIAPSERAWGFPQERFRWLSDYLHASKQDDWYLANTAGGFWTRRAIDGTDDQIFGLVVDMLEAFEPDVLQAAVAPPPFE